MPRASITRSALAGSSALGPTCSMTEFAHEQPAVFDLAALGSMVISKLAFLSKSVDIVVSLLVLGTLGRDKSHSVGHCTRETAAWRPGADDVLR